MTTMRTTPLLQQVHFTLTDIAKSGFYESDVTLHCNPYRVKQGAFREIPVMETVSLHFNENRVFPVRMWAQGNTFFITGNGFAV